MAKFVDSTSHTFDEYLLIPRHTSEECTPDRVSLKTPLVKFKRGTKPALSMNIPMVSAIMQAVSGDRLAVALAKEGGVSFIYGSQPIDKQAEMVYRAKRVKAGFVESDSNLKPDDTLADVLSLKENTGHSTVAITEDGTSAGKLVGIVTGRDYRISRMKPNTKVRSFMTPKEKLIYAKDGATLSECNDMI